MSIRDSLGKDYINLPKVLDPYIKELDEYKEHLRLEGKLLEHANREHASWVSYYDERRVELSTLVKFFELEISKTKSIIFKGMEQYPRELSDRQKDKYIESHDNYLRIYELYLVVRELYGQFESAVECFKQRGYSLRNITNARVAGLEDAPI